ncbi:MAG TPA: aconitase family protein [Candidatus Limnocylindria bacterium]|nr:aconitase family protein [Candidatus Limnocylindria bacterium]
MDGRAALDAGGELALRVDHVLIDEADAVLVLLELEAIGCERVRTELAFACLDSGSAWPGFEAAERSRYVLAAAERLGVITSRPGRGLAHHLYVERHAAPGKLVVGSAAQVASCGGLGMLALGASECELAAILAGQPLRLTMPERSVLHLRGTLPWWIDAQDLAFALAAQRDRSRWEGAVLEVTGPGVSALDVDERVFLAGAIRSLGVQAALFPSDALTRRYLKAQGREPDWKPLGEWSTGDPAEGADLDLDALEPRVVGAIAGGEPVRVRDLAGERIERVIVGPEAGYLHLATLAALLHQRHVPPGIELAVVPGSRQILETALRDGVLERLRSAGARVLDVGGSCDLRRIGWALEPGAVMTFGVPAPAATGRPEPRPRWRAGLATAAGCALTGRLVDPRDVEVGSSHGEAPESFVLCDERIRRIAEPAQTPFDSGESLRTCAVPEPLAGPIRGVVLLKLGDRVPVAHLLSRTPRTERVWSDLRSLARHAFAAVDPGFAARAARAGGGVLVSGRELGGGHREARAAIVLRELGVRAVLARSWVAEFRRDVIQHGVLPLTFVTAGAYHAVAAGDELELPTLPEGLEPNRPLVVRNLTQAAQYAVRHDLTSREIVEIRAGGLLGIARVEPARSAAAASRGTPS